MCSKERDSHLLAPRALSRRPAQVRTQKPCRTAGQAGVVPDHSLPEAYSPGTAPGPVIALSTDARLVAHQPMGIRQADLSSLNVLNVDGRLLLQIRTLRFDHARRAHRAYQEKHCCEWSPHGTPPLRRIRAGLAPSGGPSQLDSAAPLGG